MEVVLVDKINHVLIRGDLRRNVTTVSITFVVAMMVAV